MTYAVMVARQRSGTGALNSLFEQSLEIVCTGEFLSPNSRNSHSLSSLAGQFDCQHLTDAVRVLVDRFATENTRYLLDVKMSSLGFVSPPFRSFANRPWLLDVFREHAARIIWVDRNPVHQWISGRLADKNRVWHLDQAAHLDLQKIEIDIEKLKNYLRQCEVEDARLADWLKDFSVLKLQYEDVFTDKSFAGTVDTVAKFLSVKRHLGWDQVRPGLKKIAPTDLSTVVTNMREVERLVAAVQTGR